MPRTKQVKITKDDQEGWVMPESVAAWERHGWTAEDDGSSDKAKPKAKAKKEEEG